MAAQKDTAVEAFVVDGCDCLTCEGFRSKGIEPRAPRTHFEAAMSLMRPIRSTTRQLMVVRMRGGEVLGVSVRPVGAEAA